MDNNLIAKDQQIHKYALHLKTEYKLLTKTVKSIRYANLPTSRGNMHIMGICIGIYIGCTMYN